MRRIKNNDEKKVTEEGQWFEAEITKITEKNGKFFVYCVCPDNWINSIREFISKPLNTVPKEIGVGSMCHVCIWDNDEYVIDLDGCLSVGHS